jgi:Sucrase/ferredoxin-like
VWAPDALPASSLPAPVKAHLGAQLRALGRSRLLLIRRPERRREPRIAVLQALSAERSTRLGATELGSYEELLDLDFTASPLPEAPAPLLLACTHGKRDRCCARYGQPLYEELRRQAERDGAWQCTHVGGDRFAGNLVVLPHGLYYGRVGRADVRPLLDDHAAGRIRLDRFRGRSCFPLPVQAAEHDVRSRTGLDALDAVMLAGVDATPDGWCVRLRETRSGALHEVDVSPRPGEPAFLTCSASRAELPRRYVTTGHRLVRA